MADSTGIWNPDERVRRIQAAVEDVVQRRVAGESLPDKEVIDQNPDLMPELGEKLKVLGAIAEQLDKEAGEDGPRFAPGDKIHRYVVQRMLGEGHFGTVYLARDENLGRLVAIKVPRSERLAQESFVEQYLEEAHTVARLENDGIMPIYDADRIEDKREKQTANEELLIGSAIAWIAGNDPTPSSVVAEQQRNDAVREAIKKFQGRELQAITAHQEGKTNAEIAAQLKTTPGAVRALLQRIRGKLHDDLGRTSKWFSQG